MMYNTKTLLLGAALAIAALTAPTPQVPVNQPASFAVPRVRQTGYVRDGSRAMVQAYRKFGWQMSTPGAASNDNASTETGTSEIDIGVGLSSFVEAIAPASASSAPSTADQDSKGEVAATPAHDGAEYLSQVTIGGQSLTLNFDTGSADLWVFSTYLTATEIGGHSAYDPSKSSTFQELDGATFNISYGDGSGALGIVGFDTVNIGGATVAKQAIELATNVSSAFVNDTDSDGIVGLAFPVLNMVKPNAQSTFFENIMATLEQPLFTVDLDLDGSGTYEFGVIDPTKFMGELTFVPIDTTSGFWMCSSPTYSIGGVSKTPSNPSPAVLDTGTSLMLMDPAVVEDYYSQVSGSQVSVDAHGWIFPCSATLPDFSVSIGGSYTADVPGSSLTYASISSETCFGGLQSNGGSGLQIFGDVLLQHHFTVFHGETAMVGMAKKA